MNKFDIENIKQIIQYTGYYPVIKLKYNSSYILLSVTKLPKKNMDRMVEFINSHKFRLEFISENDIKFINSVVEEPKVWIHQNLQKMGLYSGELYDTMYRACELARIELCEIWDKHNDKSESTLENEEATKGILDTESLENLATPKQITPTQEEFLARQFRCYANKLRHGFNVTDFQKEARFILKELSELMDAIEHNDVENIVEELGDIVIFCYGIAEMAHRDLDAQIFKKMAINESRIYTRNAVGDFVKQI